MMFTKQLQPMFFCPSRNFSWKTTQASGRRQPGLQNLVQGPYLDLIYSHKQTSGDFSQQNLRHAVNAAILVAILVPACNHLISCVLGAKHVTGLFSKAPQ